MIAFSTGLLCIWAIFCIINIFFYTIANPNVNWLMFLMNICRWYFPATMFCICYFLKENKYLTKILTPKIWIPVLITLTIYAIYNWIYSSNNDFFVGEFGWQWIAIITYAMFFSVQLLIFHKNKINNLTGWVLTVFGCNLTSILYEIPFYINNMVLVQLFLNGVLYLFLLFNIKYQLSWHLIPATVWLLACYVVDFLNPVWGTSFWQMFIWLPRLAPIPLFLVIALKIQSRTKH